MSGSQKAGAGAEFRKPVGISTSAKRETTVIVTHTDPSVKVLLTCADKDIQVSCAAVKPLADGFPPGVVTFVTLTGTDHVLKETSRSDGTEYAQNLTFSKQMKTSLKELIQSWAG